MRVLLCVHVGRETLTSQGLEREVLRCDMVPSSQRRRGDCTATVCRRLRWCPYCPSPSSAELVVSLPILHVRLLILDYTMTIDALLWQREPSLDALDLFVQWLCRTAKSHSVSSNSSGEGSHGGGHRPHQFIFDTLKPLLALEVGSFVHPIDLVGGHPLASSYPPLCLALKWLISCTNRIPRDGLYHVARSSTPTAGPPQPETVCFSSNDDDQSYEADEMDLCLMNHSSASGSPSLLTTHSVRSTSGQRMCAWKDVKTCFVYRHHHHRLTLLELQSGGFLEIPFDMGPYYYICLVPHGVRFHHEEGIRLQPNPFDLD